MSIEGNVFDGHTLKPQIDQVKEMMGYVPKNFQLESRKSVLLRINYLNLLSDIKHITIICFIFII